MRHEFTIRRSIWLRGEGRNASSVLLRTSDGRQCCVGIYLESVGVPRGVLEGKAAASSLGHGGVPDSARWLLLGSDVTYNRGSDSVVADDLYRANDTAGPGEALREARIFHLFESQGILVRFED